MFAGAKIFRVLVDFDVHSGANPRLKEPSGNWQPSGVPVGEFVDSIVQSDDNRRSQAVQRDHGAHLVSASRAQHAVVAGAVFFDHRMTMVPTTELLSTILEPSNGSQHTV